ncbi:hypothetical protein DM01DRAFT_1335666 [Hesseltinella vesiculosa]|uniref:C2H2-type domain-containing protein n=1 Tax=Hesseltinella vesiculosa TaxID=101127 RepID=A0A1X2GII7_9FUNG|nr:hypothetical protein DM01DRAFT_1335666 [Hesseltinella vesiculosa]
MDRRMNSPGRGRGYSNLSDEDMSPRDKFRRERSIERDYMDDYGHNTDEYGRYNTHRKRPHHSPSPPEDRRRKYRRNSPSPPPPYRYGRRRVSKDERDLDGDRYYPKYDREGYSGNRYDRGRPYNNGRQGGYPRKQNGPRFNYDNQMMMAAANTWAAITPRPMMVDPYKLDYTMPFRQFSDYVRQTSGKQINDDEIQKQYDAYKEKQSIKQLAQFFNNNKDKQWFLERYHPVVSKERVYTMQRQRRLGLDAFLKALDAGELNQVRFDLVPDDDQQDDPIDLAHHLIIKAVPPTISRSKLESLCSQVPGFEYLAISDPSPSKKFQRIGWIHFSDETDLQQAFDQLDNQTVDDFVIHLAIDKKPPSASASSSINTGRTKKSAPDLTQTADRLAKDLDQARALAQVLDNELDITAGIQTVLDRSGQQIPDLTDDTKRTLDLIIAYLRRVHMYCYYCGLECDSYEELNRRCPMGHVRKLPAKDDPSTKAERSAQQWAKHLDQRINLKMNPPDDDDITKLGGKSLKSELEQYFADHIQKEHDAKFKCKVGECAKAFKGVEFVEKHIYSKHPEEVDKLKDDILFYNSYVLDPNHILPVASTNNNPMNQASASMMMPPMAPMSLPMDQIPRIGFSTGPWATPPMPRIPPGKAMDMLSDMPQDPRQVKSYVDLDAPADGDSNISFY